MANTYKYLAHPNFSTGVTLTTSASAWTAVDITPLAYHLTRDAYVSGLTFQLATSPPAADTTYEYLFEVCTGQKGSEAVKIQVPWSYRGDTITSANNGLSYWMLNPQQIFFPEMVFLPMGTILSARAYSSIAGAQTIGGFKLLFNVENILVQKEDEKMTNNYQSVVVGNGMSIGDKIR